MNNNSLSVTPLDINQNCSVMTPGTPQCRSSGATHCSIGHFQVPKTVTFKTRLRAKPFCDNEFLLHQNKKAFSYHLLCTQPCFETEAWETWKWPSHSTVTGWQEFLFPIKFQHYGSRLLLFVDFLRYEFSNKFQFTNWMYLLVSFPDE